MIFHNKNQIAYFSALTLLFSYAEMFIPKFVPFFKIGLSNIPILVALPLPFPQLFLLSIIKSVASSTVSGTLFSPFFIISFFQSIISGSIMWILFKIGKKFFSLYGISLIGSAISAIIQILISSLYLGEQTLTLLGPMLIFSIISGIITAFFAYFLKIPSQAPALKTAPETSNFLLSLFLATCLIIAIFVCFFIQNLLVLAIYFIIALILQIISKRKFLILPHISMWIFVILISLLSPNGEVLLKLGFFIITKDSLFIGLEKALKLSIVACLSQCATSIKIPANWILGLTFAHFKQLSDKYKIQKGNPIQKLQNTFSE